MDHRGGAPVPVEPWVAAWSWTWGGVWWSPPSRSTAGATAGFGGHRRQQPLHERVPLSEREQRTLLDLETDLPGAPSGDGPPAPGRGMRAVLAVLILVLAAVLSVDGAGPGALGLVVLVGVLAAVAWVRGGEAGPTRPGRPA